MDMKPCPDGFDAIEDALTRSRTIIEALRTEIAALKAVEEIDINGVTYRTNAGSTNAKLMAEVAKLTPLAYIGEHHFPNNTYKARLDEIVPKYRALEAEVASLRAMYEGELTDKEESAVFAWRVNLGRTASLKEYDKQFRTVRGRRGK